MTIQTWPNLSRKAPQQFEWSLISSTQTFSSPLSGAVQTVEMPGARWAFTLSLNTLDANDSALWRSFMARLRGQSGRFYFWNVARPTPRGAATGTPVVNGAGQTGNTLATTGWTANVTGILKEGDFFTVGGELKMLVADADSNPSGQATLTFEPPLRASPTNGSALVTNKPTAIFKLDDDIARSTTMAPGFDSITIAATEVW